MATTKSSTKNSSAKRPSTATAISRKTGTLTGGVALRPEPTEKPPRKTGPAKTSSATTRVPEKTAADGAKAVRPGSAFAATISSDQRRHYIEIAAYYIAERRGFAPGNPADDWAQAEAEIERLLAAGGSATGNGMR